MLESLYQNVLCPLRDYLMIDALGGPRPLQMRQIINLQKGSSGIFFLLLILLTGKHSFSAYLYTALHGSYGIIWLMKDHIIPDSNWNRRVTIASTVVISIFLLGYWSAGCIVIIGGVSVSPQRACLAVWLHTVGVVLMMCTDTQKYFTLRIRKGLISDGWVKHCRNTNYLGEVMIYSTYAILAQHWFPWSVYGVVWAMVFVGNMIDKDASLRKKAGAEDYFKRTWLFVPNVVSWAQSSAAVDAKRAS